MSKLAALLLRPTDLAWLAAFRVLYGVSMCISMLRLLGEGWVYEFFVKPQFYFKYWGFEWVRAFSPSVMYGFVWLLGGLALLIALGFCFRIAAVLFVAGFTYLQLIDVSTYLNHYYLASLLGLLLAISPAHRLASVDAALRRSSRREHGAAAWHYLFRFQVGIVYTFAGLAKAHDDWLFSAQPLGIWLGAHTDLPLLGPLFALKWTPLLMSWAGFLFDTTIIWWLMWSKTRPFAYLAVIAFHTVTGLLFPIGMFPFIMTGAALVFFPPDWPRRLLRRPPLRIEARAEVPPSGGPRLGRALVAGLGVAYCAAQLLVPVRFLAYGGNVRWHEQGMRFSWRVMVREKNGSVVYVVRQKQTGRVWHVSPSRYLTPRQEREMSSQPDLILQLAHHIERDFEAHGRGPVEVRADARVSLNGRVGTQLVDPDVDLSKVSDGLGKASWILSAPRGSAPRIRPI